MLRRLCASHIMTSGDVKYWIGFNLVTGIGPVRVRSLVQTFGSIEAAWKAAAEELRKAGLGEKLVQRLVEARSDLDLGKELARVQQLGLQVLPMDDPLYPARLKEIESPPLVLYPRGSSCPKTSGLPRSSGPGERRPTARRSLRSWLAAWPPAA